MLATITLTGWEEVLFYCMCLYFAIDFFVALPRLLNELLDLYIKRKSEKSNAEKCGNDILLIQDIEKKIKLYKSEKSMEGLSKTDKQILHTKIATLEDVVAYWKAKSNLTSEDFDL